MIRLKSFSEHHSTYVDSAIQNVTKQIETWLKNSQEIEIIAVSHTAEIIEKNQFVTALIFYKEK